MLQCHLERKSHSTVSRYTLFSLIISALFLPLFYIAFYLACVLVTSLVKPSQSPVLGQMSPLVLCGVKVFPNDLGVFSVYRQWSEKVVPCAACHSHGKNNLVKLLTVRCHSCVLWDLLHRNLFPHLLVPSISEVVNVTSGIYRCIMYWTAALEYLIIFTHMLLPIR